jgi:hypothetical protein
MPITHYNVFDLSDNLLAVFYNRAEALEYAQKKVKCKVREVVLGDRSEVIYEYVEEDDRIIYALAYPCGTFAAIDFGTGCPYAVGKKLTPSIYFSHNKYNIYKYINRFPKENLQIVKIKLDY